LLFTLLLNIKGVKIKLIAFTRQDEVYITEGTEEYFKRIKRYTAFETSLLKPGSSNELIKVKEQEGEILFKQLDESDFVILLDAGGKLLSSGEFSSLLQQQMNSSRKRVVFVVGGAYGFSEKVLKRADYKLSLSKMTFPHQLCRLIFAEQLYRAFTILNNEKYHH
jgi:23S rRNA (pseudouridine1915-N3)-methyltransferase